MGVGVGRLQAEVYGIYRRAHAVNFRELIFNTNTSVLRTFGPIPLLSLLRRHLNYLFMHFILQPRGKTVYINMIVNEVYIHVSHLYRFYDEDDYE